MIRQLAYWYLVFVPLVVAAVGFAFPGFDPAIYLPVWIVNAVLMFLACRFLVKQHWSVFPAQSPALRWSACLLTAPWIFIALFAGFGPPPETVGGWVAELGEQRIRYAFLVLGAVLVPSGFALLALHLRNTGETIYSTLAFTLVLIAAPPFILNMCYWGSFLGEAFILFESSGTTSRPDWYPPVRSLFEWISTVEVSLTYLATAAFAVSLKNTATFSNGSSLVYIVSALIGFVLTLAGAVFPGPLAIPGFFVTIPAIPLVMPYLIGVNMLRIKRLKSGIDNPGLYVLRS